MHIFLCNPSFILHLFLFLFLFFIIIILFFLRGDEAEERLIKMGYTKDTCKLYLSRSGIKYIKYIAVHIHV